MDLSGSEISKNFNHETLVFVTPWNHEGKKYTTKYAKKIDYVSPVWFDMKSNIQHQNQISVALEGETNIDENYIRALKSQNDQLKVVPRVYLSSEDRYSLEILDEKSEVYLNLFQEFISQTGDTIDGIVFDSPLLSYLSLIETDLLDFLGKLSDLMHRNNKLFMASLMGSNENIARRKTDIQRLLKISDKLLICTYDYLESTPGTKQLSPYSWVKHNIETFMIDFEFDYELVSNKLLMGIPFYGFKLENGQMSHLLGKEYIEILKESNPKLTWNSDTRECEITARQKNSLSQIYYPCLRFIKERLELFEEDGVGAFVWDGGQGLPYFYELF